MHWNHIGTGSLNQSEASQNLVLDASQREMDQRLNKEMPKSQIAVKKSFAKKYGIKVGDVLAVTEKISRDRTGRFEVGDIFENNQWDDIIMDLSHTHFTSVVESDLQAIYIVGDLETIRPILDDIQTQYPALNWTNYQEIINMSNQKISERSGLFLICILGLVFLISLGWINSLYSILEDRRRDYAILRTLGYCSLRLFKIISIQSIIYIIMGIFFGSLGSALLLWCLDLRQFGFGYYIGILLYMTVISMFVIPKIITICWCKNNIEIINRMN